MNRNEILNLLKRGQETILRLRRANEILGAKVETMETMRLFLMSEPRLPGTGAEVDIAWEMGRAADELEAEAQAIATGTPT